MIEFVAEQSDILIAEGIAPGTIVWS